MNPGAQPARWLNSPLAACLLLGGAGVACAVVSIGRVSSALLEAQPLREMTLEGESFPKTLRDPAGAAQILPAPPRRVASCTLASDEILTRLLDSERFVAVTKYADDPRSSNCVGLLPRDAARLGYAEAETILALEPDLAIVAQYSRAETVRLLTASGVPVARLGLPASFDDVRRHIRLLGAATGTEDRARALVAELDARLAVVEARVRGRPRPRVLFYGANAFTAGAGTLLNEMFERAGARNAAAEAGVRGNAMLGLEAAVALNPDAVIVPERGPGDGARAADELRAGPLWRETPAVRAGRIYAVRAAWLDCVSQYAVDGVEALARCLHPEAFGP